MKNTSLNSEKFKKRIGNNIRIIRELKNISQAPLCDQINKSQSTLSHYENGQSSMTIDIFFDICQYLDVPPELMVSKDFALIDCLSFPNNQSNSHIPQQYKFSSDKHDFEDKSFYLYYFSTSQNNQIVESDLITTSLQKNNYIPFLFEVKHNSPDKQLYEGNLVFEAQHAYFYFRNKKRNERGLIVTYLYEKNKNTPYTLLGLMISISHGSEQRPCFQKCFITSQKIDSKLLKPFLKIDASHNSLINNDFLITLPKSSDKEIYNWINKSLN